jgi:hypothetical protein
VYANFDGYAIWLLANDHRNPTDTICLEPSVLRSINQFKKEIDMPTASKTLSLTKKEESHLFWLKQNGATPEHLILAIMSAGRTRGWTPRYTAETISRFFIWKEVENKS